MQSKSIISPGGIIVLGVTTVSLAVTSYQNYLLFHSLVEIFSVVVAFGIFILAWNSREVLYNNYLLFLGIAYLFIGMFDLIHTLGYKGMGFMQEGGANLPTQLWIVARYLESVSLLVAVPLALDREIKAEHVFAAFSLISGALLGAIYTGIFPVCYIEGLGLTPFKKISEYLISIFLLGAFLMLRRQRDRFEPGVYRLLAVAIWLTIGAELAFTFYVSVVGFSNLAGHILKFISFYLIYKALVETGLKRPYKLLFRDLKNSEEMLRVSEQEFRSMFELSVVGMTQINPATGCFTRVNDKYCLITGYEPEELLGLSFSDITHPDDRSADSATVNSAVNGSDSSWISEKRYIRKDGKIIWVRVNGTLIRDKAGQPVHGTEIVEDVTERIQTRQALAESEWRFRGTFDNAAVGIAHVSLDGSWLLVNHKLCSLLGYTVEELLTKNFRDITYPEEQQEDLFPIENLVSGKKDHFDAEMRYISSNGDPVWVHLTVSLQQEESGRPRYFIVVIQDISARKQAEEELGKLTRELKRSNADLEQFAYIATHDLQEPLRTVGSFAQLLSRRYKGKLDVKADEFIGYIIEGTVRMQKLLNDLLEYSRVNMKEKILQEVELGRLAEQARQNLQAAIDESGAEIRVYELPVARVDEIQIIQLFQNLIGNSIKFRGSRTPMVDISCERHGDEWIIHVRDNGIGIESKYYQKVFIIFNRLHHRDEYPGTGLGLALCKKIVERHGGRLWVDSTPGESTIFSFSLTSENSNKSA